LVDFKNQKVLAYDDDHVQFLSISDEEFRQYFKSLHKNARISEGSDQDYLTSEELSKIVEPFLSEVPDLSWDKDISEADK
jgi:topoisomerase IA-like protein